MEILLRVSSAHTAFRTKVQVYILLIEGNGGPRRKASKPGAVGISPPTPFWGFPQSALLSSALALGLGHFSVTQCLSRVNVNVVDLHTDFMNVPYRLGVRGGVRHFCACVPS